MKAAVFHGKNDLRVEEVPIRQPDDDEILVKVIACGVCGTDLHIFHGDKGAAECSAGTILGHEFSGIVEKIGCKVENVKIGDSVCIDPNNYCGECFYCRKGMVHFCTHMIGYGTTVNGGFAEYCTVKAKQAYLLSESMPVELGSMGEPISCCLHGIDLCNIKTGDTVLIIGAGAIGLLMLQLAKLSGASSIIVIDPVEEKHTIAYELGATICFNPDSIDIMSELSSLNLLPINVSIECVGLGSTVEAAIRYAGNGATVMMFGLTPPDCEIALKPFDIFQRELHLTASFINPYTIQRALNIIESKSILIEPLIGDRVPLEKIIEVFEDSSYRKIGKVLIFP